MPDDDQLRALERDLDKVFQSRNRGRGSQVFPYSKEDGVWFLVRHGDAYRREGIMDEDGPCCVFYRPEKRDVVVYDPRIGELRVNASSEWEKQLYRAKFGKHLFGSEHFFPGTGKYTLEPLRRYGEGALNCIDVEGIEWVTLKEVHYYWGNKKHKIEVRRADDLFAVHEIRQEPRLLRAGFEVKFSDSRTPRSLVVRPSNVAQYTRDADSTPIENWLIRRGFVGRNEEEDDASVDTVLAVAGVRRGPGDRSRRMKDSLGFGI
ncbi:MAG TPA: hypothetical protein VMY42_14840 [Thermoguttaceae bacterium]|nr:hypothetical protein [Thermoguttaceae bacterium]